LTAALLVAAAWGLRHPSAWFVTLPFAALCLYCMVVVFTDYHGYFLPVFFAFGTAFVGFAGWGLWRSPARARAAPFLLCALYCLLTPVFADYHLLVFLAPPLLAALNSREGDGYPPLMAAVGIGSVLVLAPKNYVFIRYPSYFPSTGYSCISLQTIFNPLVLYLIAFYVAGEAARLFRSSASEAEFSAPELTMKITRQALPTGAGGSG